MTSLKSIEAKLTIYEAELRKLTRNVDQLVDDYEHARRLLRDAENKLHDFHLANARELAATIETTRENVMESAA